MDPRSSRGHSQVQQRDKNDVSSSVPVAIQRAPQNVVLTD